MEYDTGTSPIGEKRLENGVPFIFYHSIEECDADQSINCEFCLGEMPVGAFMYYQGIV
jgi:hypothetical protein